MDNLLEEPVGGALSPAEEVLPPALLNQGQKAAVIVQLMLTHEVPLPLERLTARQQQRLAEYMTTIQRVDRNTLANVVDEFVDSLDGVGLTFPRGLPDALEMLEPYLSPDAKGELRSAADKMNLGDAWERLANLDIDELLHLIANEGAEVCAILLSKLPVAKAAELLAELPPDRAEVVTHSVALTGSVGPHTVRRIGAALVAQLDARPAPAFRANAADRVGQILNVAPRPLRESLMDGLGARDTDFAEAVRATLFSFDHIPHRVDPSDLPAIIRAVDEPTLVVALAGAMEQFPLTFEFIRDALPKRMSEGLRDEALALGKVDEAESEAAMTAVVGVIRAFEERGEITLLTPSPEEIAAAKAAARPRKAAGEEAA